MWRQFRILRQTKGHFRLDEADLMWDQSKTRRKG